LPWYARPIKALNPKRQPGPTRAAFQMSPNCRNSICRGREDSMAESSEIGGSMHVEDGSSAQKEEWIK